MEKEIKNKFKAVIIGEASSQFEIETKTGTSKKVNYLCEITEENSPLKGSKLRASWTLLNSKDVEKPLLDKGREVVIYTTIVLTPLLDKNNGLVLDESGEIVYVPKLNEQGEPTIYASIGKEDQTDKNLLANLLLKATSNIVIDKANKLDRVLNDIVIDEDF